jgi:NitT/TauT family transport system ATP-binding protein
MLPRPSKIEPVKSSHSIELNAVDRRYETGLLALQDVNLGIGSGEFVSLLGPSGCGKSSVLRLLAGLDRPTQGEVRRKGEVLSGPVGDTGFVFQEPTLMPWANVATNVELPLRLQGGMAPEDRDKAARAALAAVGLAEFADAAPRELSGGMKMRAAIARALVTQPSLLLLDEPFAALDEINRFALNEALLQLWRPAKARAAAFTAVFVTHSVYEAVFLSQRVLVMSARPGRIVDEVVIDAPYPRTAAFRQAPAFTAACARLSDALAQASAEPVLG